MQGTIKASWLALALMILPFAGCSRDSGSNFVPKGPPVVKAAARGDLAEVKRLLAADVGAALATSDNGTSAAGCAILNNHIEVAKYLYEHGIPMDPTPELPCSALFSCVSRYTPESTEMLKWLLERGANPNVRFAKEGWIPVNMAVNNGMPEKVRLLVKHGADLNQSDGHFSSPLAMMKNRLAAYQRVFRKGEVSTEMSEQFLIFDGQRRPSSN